MALSDVDRQVSHSLSMLLVLAQGRRPERTRRATYRLVDRGLHHSPHSPGRQLGRTLAVQRVRVDLGGGRPENCFSSGKCGVHGTEVRQSVRIDGVGGRAFVKRIRYRPRST